MVIGRSGSKSRFNVSIRTSQRVRARPAGGSSKRPSCLEGVRCSNVGLNQCRLEYGRVGGRARDQ